MERFLNELSCNPKEYSSLSLAFIGDCVFELFVREKLVCRGNTQVKKLHEQSVKSVCCQAQNEFAKKIEDKLTEEEKDIMRRGKNTHTGHVPKNSSVADYHGATGLESLFGYLYLSGKLKRLKELFSLLDIE